MSVLLVRKPMFYVTDSSINYLAVLESPLSKQENKMNVLNTVTHALTQNPAPDFHSVSVHWRHACQQVLQCIENRGETPPHAKKPTRTTTYAQALTYAEPNYKIPFFVLALCSDSPCM